MDNRLGSSASPSNSIQSFSFLDDDNIATYYFSEALTTGPNSGYVTDIGVAPPLPSTSNPSCISGPRGTRFTFAIKASEELENGTFLFDQIGLSADLTNTQTRFGSGETHRAIDSIIRVQGATTGYSLEIPIRYIKKSN